VSVKLFLFYEGQKVDFVFDDRVICAGSIKELGRQPGNSLGKTFTFPGAAPLMQEKASVDSVGEQPFVRRSLFTTTAEKVKEQEAFYMSDLKKYENNDVVKYEPTLRLQEQELEDIDKERGELESDILLKQMRLTKLAGKKVSRLRLHILLKDELGLPVTEDERKQIPAEIRQEKSLPKDACKGKTLVEAGEAYLIWRDEPATHREVVDGVLAGGLEVQLKSLDNSLRSAMQRSGNFLWFEDTDGVFRWAMPHWINRSPRTAVSQDANERPDLKLVERSEAIEKSA